ncbi:membrane protein [Patiriisocius marinistellae]|uniref:Membrane protein n=1 Tax=Patiriisocius marinistellae TaxID=2494560 RepID=A0A5J4G283_9FLAO|nr:MFS transporter [Patiriisocius marinistellae]GEQ86776.1 membrane protein [Patiriisocius marinistellae]
MKETNIKGYILPLIVIAQFCCTSLWFAGNSIIENLVSNFGISLNSMGILTSSVQLGFIIGTLSFAALTIADRFSPSKVFLTCAIVAALFNFGILWSGNTLITLLLFRFGTGFFLAGIYPVGMKIAADYFNKGLGKSLGYLVGALVLGTAFPHALKSLGVSFNWEYIILTTSTLAIIGGFIVGFIVPNGPYRQTGQRLKLTAFFSVFKDLKFNKAAFGYFGHMWELYAFWAFVPFIISAFNETQTNELHIYRWSFLVISIGSLGCVLTGYISKQIGTKKVAFITLLVSGICCGLSPILFHLPAYIFIPFLLLWGFVVIADSPVFSTMVAQNAIPNLKGSALTIVNCIGFSISIISIQLLAFLSEIVQPQYLFLILILGPIFGLFSLRNN